MTDALFRIVARDGTPADVARLHAALTTPEDLAEYTDPFADGVPLADVLAELEARDRPDEPRPGVPRSALRTITNRFGEEHYNLPGLGLTVRVVVVLPLSVKFTVHPGRRLVTVGTFRYIQPG